MIRASFNLPSHPTGLLFIELLIAHQMSKGVTLGKMSIRVYLPDGKAELLVKNTVVITKWAPIHLLSY